MAVINMPSRFNGRLAFSVPVSASTHPEPGVVRGTRGVRAPGAWRAGRGWGSHGPSAVL